jgi:hypothetical protein
VLANDSVLKKFTDYLRRHGTRRIAVGYNPVHRDGTALLQSL